MIRLLWWSYFTPRSPEYDVPQEEIETTFFCGVKSSSSFPGAPGIKADFTPDRNKQEKDRPSSYLRFVRLSLLLFPSNMNAQPDRTTFLLCLVPLVTFLITPHCTLLSWLILAIRRMRFIYDSSQEWVCSVYIPRVSETERIECLPCV